MDLRDEQPSPRAACMASFQANLHSAWAAGNNAFSRANIFGIFLALGFCLLTQPHGSLLYMRPSRIPGRIIFFFWRLNPLACVVEALLMLYIFIGGDRGRWYHTPHEQPISMTFKKRLQLTAAATLFLRKHTHFPEHWEKLADKQDWRSARIDASQPRSTVTTTELMAGSPIIDQSADILDEQGLVYEKEAPMRDAPPPSYPQREAAVPHSSRLKAHCSNTSTAPPPRSAQVDSRVESGQQLGSEADAVTEIQSFISGHSGFGRRTFVSAERLIHLISVISVLVVIIRIAATEIPIYIRIPAWFMLSGWATLELLITIAHRHPEAQDFADEADLIRFSIALQSRLHSSFIWKILSVLCLPMIMYLGHAAFFNTDGLADCTEWRSVIRSLTINLFLAGVFWYNIFRDIAAKLKTCGRPQINFGGCVVPGCRPIDPPRVSTVVLGLALLILWTVILAIAYAYYKLDAIISNCATNPDGRACDVLLTLNSGFWLSLWFFAPIYMFSSTQTSNGTTKQRSPNSVQVASLLWNLLITALFFVIAMMLYDAETTYKPDWLDWLKMHKSMRDIDSSDVMMDY